MSPHEVLAQHMVDVQRATADSREASERKLTTSSHTVSTNILLPDPLVKKRLSIYYLNLGPRRGKEDAFEKQLAGRWHIITLQEASEYASHDILTGRFHVTDPLRRMRDSLQQGHLSQHRCQVHLQETRDGS